MININTNLTEIVFILDRSGSMMSLTNDTIGGFNSFVEKQKNEPGEALLTTILFDDQYEILHNGMNLRDVQPMTKDQYWARGMTAMYDAIGKTINEVGRRLSDTTEEQRPGKVIFVITTDGLENARGHAWRQANRGEVGWLPHRGGDPAGFPRRQP